MAQLTSQSEIGDRVTWKREDGSIVNGQLIAWDFGTAIIALEDGSLTEVSFDVNGNMI